ncbi:MAG TPA: conjugal transfer protein TraG, partial [Buttiauxella sp.]
VQQLAATLNDAKSQYHQYTTSATQSDEYSKMASLAQNQSASLDTNYNQEFVNWASEKYGDKAPAMLTSAPEAREAAMEFVNERLKPEIMADYQQGRTDLSSGGQHEAFTSASAPEGAPSPTSSGTVASSPVASGSQVVHRNPAVSSGGVIHPASGHSREHPVSDEHGVKNDMGDDFRRHQSQLGAQAEQAFPANNDIAHRVAEQRSENAQNIHNSAGEIAQKQSTVQASSDNIKGEYKDSQRDFVTGHEAEKAKQDLIPHNADDQDIKDRLAELRKRTG